MTKSSCKPIFVRNSTNLFKRSNLKDKFMKKLLITFGSFLITLNAFAQGAIYFNTHDTSHGVDAKVYLEGVTPLAGSSYLAQLYAAPGMNSSFAALHPGSPVTTFRTGAAAGYVNPVIVTFPEIPENFVGYTVQMRVWDNSSGLFPDWASAQSAWQKGMVIANVSKPVSFAGSIGSVPSVSYLTGLQGFSLIPEPTTLAFAGVAATALLIFRRRT